MSVSYTHLDVYKRQVQLIAHAACCVLYTDREGYIRIEPANDVQDNFKLDFHTMLALSLIHI